MRRIVREVWNGGRGNPDHAGLAYDVWAPNEPWSEDPNSACRQREDRDRWLNSLEGLAVASDYRGAFGRWRDSFGEGERLEVTLASRLLVGTGNPSATEVGLTVHRTWGVPVIPGSALKGLLSHWVQETYGPAPWGRGTESSEPDGARGGRDDFRGPTWAGNRIVGGPGAFHRALFGAPPAEDDRQHEGAGATRGAVEIHDALYVPGSTPGDRPFARDVLTVHQRTYYGQGEARHDRSTAWPNDYDEPNPVGFLTVRPRAKFLLAITGDPEWCVWAKERLLEALSEWGVGAKTAAGYGRAALRVEMPRLSAVRCAPAPPVRGSDRPGDGGRRHAGQPGRDVRGRRDARGAGAARGAQQRHGARPSPERRPPPAPPRPVTPEERLDTWWRGKGNAGNVQRLAALKTPEARSLLLALSASARRDWFKGQEVAFAKNKPQLRELREIAEAMERQEGA